MERQKKSMQVGITAILCAVILKFFSVDGPMVLAEALDSPGVTAFLIYMETGRQVRLSPEEPPPPVILASFPEPKLTYAPESPPAVPPPLPVFEDPSLVATAPQSARMRLSV